MRGCGSQATREMLSSAQAEAEAGRAREQAVTAETRTLTERLANAQVQQ